MQVGRSDFYSNLLANAKNPGQPASWREARVSRETSCMRCALASESDRPPTLKPWVPVGGRHPISIQFVGKGHPIYNLLNVFILLLLLFPLDSLLLGLQDRTRVIHPLG
jgi:hypothetical protein